MHQKAAITRIGQNTLKLFLSELLRFLCDERTSFLADHSHVSFSFYIDKLFDFIENIIIIHFQIVRSVNVITVKLCENAEINECFAANLHLLDSYLQTEAPPKLVELLVSALKIYHSLINIF